MDMETDSRPDVARRVAFDPAHRSNARTVGPDREGGALDTILFPELAQWNAVLDRLALPADARVHLAARARVNGLSFQEELHASGIVSENDLYGAVADDLGLPFAGSLDPEKLVVRDADCAVLLGRRAGNAPVLVQETGGGISGIIATGALDIARTRQALGKAPSLARRLKIAPPGAVREALFARSADMLVRRATNTLFEKFPDCSVRIVVNGWQGCVFGAALIGFPVVLVVAPAVAFAALHILFSFFFLACVGLRFAAIPSTSPGDRFVAEPVTADEMPVYSVLIALYDEAEIVPELLVALGKIMWPRSKLEIKLVCEEDDHATLAAIRAQRLRPWIEVIEVPVFGPRTKPKALAYALPAASGEYVVLYDAEDKPHPLQLIEAWQRFRKSDWRLACVQAPLEISNGRESVIARMFSFEYAALFRGMLPWLSRKKLLLPLGGTSNHFRRSALDDVGGWDPYNVTEDADLGLRLARFGYFTETISSPTYEDAPKDFSTWLPQRTRWFKGWMQTWLVHMRNPFRLARELGFRSFMISQILFAGMLISAMAHPILILTGIFLVIDLVLEKTLSTYRSALLMVDVANICCGYLSFLLLGRQALRADERTGFWKIALFTPVYWVMMSAAAWRSVWQIFRRPHHWEKTRHHRSRHRPGF